MTYWQNTPPEFRARLDNLAKLFLACRDAFHETADNYHWLPVAGSPAADDALALPSPDPLIRDPRGESGHRLIAEVVQTFLLTASGHIGGLASLYASEEVVFSPPLLIRAVVENCAHALWVLGDEATEPAENRLARAYLEELLSAEEAKKNAGRMLGKTHATYTRADEDYKRLKGHILARFPETNAESLGKRLLNKQELPRLEDAVKWMYSLTEASGGTIGQVAASGIYGYLSNMTHPTLYPARRKRGWMEDASSGNAVTYVHVEIASVEDEAKAALAAFYNALTYTTSYFDWPTAVLDGLEVKIDAILPTFIH